MSRRKCMQKRNDSRKQIFFSKRRTQSDSRSFEECWHSWWILFSPASRTAASDKTLDLCVSSLRSILDTMHYKEIWGANNCSNNTRVFSLNPSYLPLLCEQLCNIETRGSSSSSSSSSRPRCLFSLSLTMNKWMGYVISQSHPALGQLKIYQHICDVWWGTGWSKETVTSNLFLTGPKI